MKSPKKPATPKPATKKDVVSKSAFAGMEDFLVKNEKVVIAIILSLATIFSVLLFDVKISEGNDDALYIEGGHSYATDFNNYRFTANAPLYPFFLGGVIALFGLKLILLKAINIVFFVASIFFIFLAFRRRIPALVMYPVLLIMALNSYFLYYASQTYTESLFMLLQGVALWGIFSSFDVILKQELNVKQQWKQYLQIGILIFILTYCKNIAIGAIAAVVMFLLIERKYVAAALSVVGYAVIKFPFEAIRSMKWGSSGQYSNQLQILMQKDAYDATQGTENINGFISRFFGNFDIYMSKRLYQILGFYNPDAIIIKTGLGILALILIAFGIYQAYRNKNKAITYLVWFTGIQAGLTFLLLQVKWDQPRLVLIYVPFMLMIIFYGLYKALEKGGASGLVAFIAVVAIVVASNFMTTTKKSVKNFPILKRNLSGDKFYGYTPDWANYLKLSEWCADSLPPNSFVACRKAPMSFVYGKGMKFYPIYTVPALDTTTTLSNPDSALALLKREKVTHFIIANLRRNPKKVDGFIINTIHRMAYPIAQKYPQKVKFVKKMGDKEDAQLFEILYDK
jgi:hypothetical protein